MEAYLYQRLTAGKVRCDLCHHRCVIGPGKRGLCQVRQNRDGKLETLVYGRLIASNVDPVEKKPIFHLLPGHKSYSVATVGCNFRCLFCQNADIAQMPRDNQGTIIGRKTDPAQVVEAALASGCRSIAYTYTEPTVFFEFVHDTARLAHSKGLMNILVTNGYLSPEALQMAGAWIDAANVDLKAFSNEFYKTYCGARLQPVKETLRRMKSSRIVVEVTTLIIPGLNDDSDQLQALASFIADDLGPETPWHISRFHPTYRLTDRPPTPLDTLVKAWEIGRQAGLYHIYTGNVPGQAEENTYCPGCGNLLIERWGFGIRASRIENGRCPDCGRQIYGVFEGD